MWCLLSYLFVFGWLNNAQTLARGQHELIEYPMASIPNWLRYSVRSAQIWFAAATPAPPLRTLGAVPIIILRGKSRQVQSPQLVLGRVLLLTLVSRTACKRIVAAMCYFPQAVQHPTFEINAPVAEVSCTLFLSFRFLILFLLFSFS